MAAPSTPTFWSELQALAHETRLSISEATRIAGLARQGWYPYRQGRRPQPETARKYARAFATRPDRTVDEARQREYRNRLYRAAGYLVADEGEGDAERDAAILRAVRGRLEPVADILAQTEGMTDREVDSLIADMLLWQERVARGARGRTDPPGPPQNDR